MKILLVEDDQSIAAIAKMALTKVGGHIVNIAQDGLEALTAVAKEKPELILLDVMMPNLDGFETCIKLKANESTKSIPVIFLTAKAQGFEQHHGMTLGAIGYILKPFDPMSLHKAIEKVLEDHAAQLKPAA